MMQEYSIFLVSIIILEPLSGMLQVMNMPVNGSAEYPKESMNIIKQTMKGKFEYEICISELYHSFSYERNNEGQ